MENYFRDALYNFIFEEAGGGAIRHLADRGYTARQIADAMSFPMPYEKVREAFTKYLLDCAVLLKEPPDSYKKTEKTEYVREYDRYGKPSFRKVVVSEEAEQEGTAGRRAGAVIKKWRVIDFSKFLLLYHNGEGGIKLPAESEHRAAEKDIYLVCDFGPDKREEMLQALDTAQRDYVQGICWTRKNMYHLLDQRMLRIAVRLQDAGMAAGKVYIRH